MQALATVRRHTVTLSLRKIELATSSCRLLDTVDGRPAAVLRFAHSCILCAWADMQRRHCEATQANTEHHARAARTSDQAAL